MFVQYNFLRILANAVFQRMDLSVVEVAIISY